MARMPSARPIAIPGWALFALGKWNHEKAPQHSPVIPIQLPVLVQDMIEK